MSDRRSEDKCDLLRHRCRNFLQSSIGASLDPPQWNCPIHPAQLMKYVNDQGEIRTLQSCQNYFTDFLLYQDPMETDWEPKDPNSGNETDAELESDEDCPWELDLSVIGQNNLDVNDTAFDDSMRYINENLELAYLFACAFDSVPSNTTTHVDDETNEYICSAIYVLPSLQVLIKSSFLTDDRIHDVQGNFFKGHAWRKHQKPFIFGRFETEQRVQEVFEVKDKPSKFFKCSSKIIRLMKKMGYNLKKKLGLNFRKWVRNQPCPLVLKGKDASYYNTSKRG